VPGGFGGGGGVEHKYFSSLFGVGKSGGGVGGHAKILGKKDNEIRRKLSQKTWEGKRKIESTTDAFRGRNNYLSTEGGDKLIMFSIFDDENFPPMV